MSTKRVGWIALVLVGAVLLAIISQILPQASGPSSPRLRVMAYSSFVSQFGPAQELKERFESFCDCEVEYVNGGDSAVMVQKLQLRKDGFHPDVVVGLDQWTTAMAQQKVKWRPLSVEGIHWVKALNSSVQETFVPFDWAPMTLIYRQDEVDPPKSLDDLTEPRFSNELTLQDPRSSTPGQQFFYWVYALKGERTFDFFEQLQSTVHSVSPSWSSSYGLFKKKQASLTFSYVTSVVYHWQEEQDRTYQAAQFSEGHPYQVEYVGVPVSCQQCELAERFVEFLLRPEAQKIIMTKNFMLPAIEGVADGTLFSEVPDLKLIPAGQDRKSQFIDQRVHLMERWLKVFRQ